MEAINDSTIVGYRTEQFIDNENVKAYFYPEIKLMHFVWLQNCVGEKYRYNFQQALDFAAKNDACYFISDIRKQGVVGPEDRKWFETVAIPGAIEQGLKRAAVIADGNIFKMYYLNMLLKVFTKMAVPFKLFNNTRLAINWLIAG